MTPKTERKTSANSERLTLDNALEVAKSCACFTLRKATRRITRFYDAALKASGLKTTQLTLLTAIRISEQVTIKRLARVMAMDRTTLSWNVSVLKRKSLIDIERETIFALGSLPSQRRGTWRLLRRSRSGKRRSLS